MQVLFSQFLEDNKEQQPTAAMWSLPESVPGCLRSPTPPARSALTYHQQGEHGLAHVEAMPPVVIGDPAVAFAQRVHEPHQGLQTHACRGDSAHPARCPGSAILYLDHELGTGNGCRNVTKAFRKLLSTTKMTLLENKMNPRHCAYANWLRFISDSQIVPQRATVLGEANIGRRQRFNRNPAGKEPYLSGTHFLPEFTIYLFRLQHLCLRTRCKKQKHLQLCSCETVHLLSD